MSHRRVDGREDDMVKSMAIASYGDAPIRREGLQAYKAVPKAVPRASLGLAYECLAKSG